MRRIRLIIMVASSFLSACSSPIVKGTLFKGAKPLGAEAKSLALRPGEAIVVLSAESTAKDDAWPADCVRDAIEREDSNIRLMTPQAFRDAAFPWFETHEVGEGIAELKKVPSISRAVDAIGVRYIISVAGQTSTPDLKGQSVGGFYVGEHGVLVCSGAPPGCVGFVAWQRTSDVSATIWDFKRSIRAAGIAAKISGKSVVPAFILAVPLIAPTETAVCRELGYQIARFVTTGEMPETAEVGDDAQVARPDGQGALKERPATDR